MSSSDIVRFRPLLDFIASHEGTSSQPGGGYDTSLGYGRYLPGGREQDLTAKTLEQIDDLQSQMLANPENPFDSSALGRYQIVRRTLRDLRKSLKLDGNARFSPTLQDRLAVALIERRGRNADGLRLEWASLKAVSRKAILRVYDQDGSDSAPMMLFGDYSEDVFTTEAARPFVPSQVGRRRADDFDIAEEDDRGESSEEGTLLYHVERVGGGFDALQQAINRLASEGWRLTQIIPAQKDFIFAMEIKTTSAPADEFDDCLPDDFVADLSLIAAEGDGAAGIAPASVSFASANFDLSKFKDFIEKLALKNISYRDLLVLGGQHFSGKCKGLNTYPPEDLWNNIAPTAKVLDKLADKLGGKITVNSAYRSPPYNDCIPGAAGGSVHMKFQAVDFRCSDGKGPVHWARVLKQMRDKKAFVGGIGVYQTFVHVDTRGYNANFGPLMNRVFP